MDNRINGSSASGRTRTEQPSTQPRRFVRTFVNSKYRKQHPAEAAGIPTRKREEREETNANTDEAATRTSKPNIEGIAEKTTPRPEKTERTKKQYAYEDRMDAEGPGPSGLIYDRLKQRYVTEDPTTRAPLESISKGSPDTDLDEAAVPNAEPMNIHFRKFAEDIQRLVCQKVLDRLLPNQTRLGTEFATMMQIMAGASETWIGDIHTVAVSHDSIVFIRKNGLEHSYIFDWRKREDYTALKIMATLRERGYWTCERIKIFQTRPRLAFGATMPPGRTTDVMHEHLAELLRRFGATKEVKITECPFFWENEEVNCLQHLTTALQNTPITRGIPNARWLPGGKWTGEHQQPILLRRADAYRNTVPNYRWRCRKPTDVEEHLSSYSSMEDIPIENSPKQHRFPPLDFSQATSTLQVFTWEFPDIYQKLSVRTAPNHFERVDLTMSTQQAQTRLVSVALDDIHSALDDYHRLKKLNLTVRTTDYKDDGLWEDGDGEVFGAYVVSMLKTITNTERECREPTARNQNRDIPSEVQLLVNADDWYTTMEAIRRTSATVQEALERYARQHNGTVSSTEGDVGTTISVQQLTITENCSLSATIMINELVYGRSSTDERRTDYDDRSSREAILENLGEHMRKDLEEDA